jgi:hypothetical protein
LINLNTGVGIDAATWKRCLKLSVKVSAILFTRKSGAFSKFELAEICRDGFDAAHGLLPRRRIPVSGNLVHVRAARSPRSENG